MVKKWLLKKIFSLRYLGTNLISLLSLPGKGGESSDFYYRETGEEYKEVNLFKNLSS